MSTPLPPDGAITPAKHTEDEKVDESKFLQWIVELRNADTREKALLELRLVHQLYKSSNNL